MPTYINLHLLGAGLCLLGAPLYLPLHVGCLPLPVGCPSLSASACWVPASAGWVSLFICLCMVDACLCPGYLSAPRQLGWHGAFPLQAHRENRVEGQRAALRQWGRERERGRERGGGCRPGTRKPQALSDWRPRPGPSPLPHPAHPPWARPPPRQPEGCLLLPWCRGPAGRMEQDPKPPRLRLWALLPWMPRKQRPRISQTSLPAPGPGSGPRRDSVSVAGWMSCPD